MAESEDDRLNRELLELLQELRVALPGVQMLVGFLLILPFTSGFTSTSQAQRDVYFATFLCATVASALFIAPSAYHRLNFRRHDRERMLPTTNKLAIAGTVFLAFAIAGTVFLVSAELFRNTLASVLTGAIALFVGWLWFAFPLVRRHERGTWRPNDVEGKQGPATP